MDVAIFQFVDASNRYQINVAIPNVENASVNVFSSYLSASSSTYGGVKADSAEGTDTQPVRIGTDGKLYTAPGSSGGGTDTSLGVTGATVGQTVKIKSVDENGVPTAWEAVDMPSGGEREWIKIGEVTNAEDTTKPLYIKFTKDINGNSLSLKGVLIIGTPLFSDTNTHQCALKCNDSPYGSGVNYFLYRSILHNKQTFTIYSEFLLGDGVNSVVVTVSNAGNVKQNGGAESFINTWSPTKEESVQFPIHGIDFGVIDSGLLAGSKFEFWGVKA